MRMKTWVFAGVLAALLVLSGAGPSAYAAHAPKPPRLKVKKNMGPYGGNYMAPKKQKKPTGYYRSSVTGKTVYGKPPKSKN